MAKYTNKDSEGYLQDGTPVRMPGEDFKAWNSRKYAYDKQMKANDANSAAFGKYSSFDRYQTDPKRSAQLKSILRDIIRLETEAKENHDKGKFEVSRANWTAIEKYAKDAGVVYRGKNEFSVGNQRLSLNDKNELLPVKPEARPSAPAAQSSPNPYVAPTAPAPTPAPSVMAPQYATSSVPVNQAPANVLPGVRRDAPATQAQAPQPARVNPATKTAAKQEVKTEAQRTQETLIGTSKDSQYVDTEGNVRRAFDFDAFSNDMKAKIEQDINLKQLSVTSDQDGLDADENVRRAQTKKNLNRLGQTIGLAVNLGDMLGAGRDRRRADNLRDQIQEPSFAVRGQNRGLLRELRDAEQRRMNPYGQVAPVQDQINLGYQQDLAQAQGISGGQASTMGSLGGAAAIRRDRNLGGLATAATGAVGAQDQRISGLLQQQVADDSNRDYLGLFKFQTDTNRAMQEGGAVGDAMASSRLREIQSRNNVLNNLLTSDAFDVNTYSNMIRNNAIKNWGRDE